MRLNQRPRKTSGLKLLQADFEQVLRRPMETTPNLSGSANENWNWLRCRTDKPRKVAIGKTEGTPLGYLGA
jgi:hypothetical protein